jgi:hypothetical protein
MQVTLTDEQWQFLENEVIPANKRMVKIFQEIMNSQNKSTNTVSPEIAFLESLLEYPKTVGENFFRLKIQKRIAQLRADA